jgi:lysophospholipase L1-like esterase
LKNNQRDSAQPDPADPKAVRMAHRDPKVAESSRFMARPKRSGTVVFSSDPTWSPADEEKVAGSNPIGRRIGGALAAIPAFFRRRRSHEAVPGDVASTVALAIASGKIVAPPDITAIPHIAATAPKAGALPASTVAPGPAKSSAVSAGHASNAPIVPVAQVVSTTAAPTATTTPRIGPSRGWSLPTGRSFGRRRFGPREQHRRELAVVLFLLLVASAVSWTLPQLTASSPKATASLLADASTDDPGNTFAYGTVPGGTIVGSVNPADPTPTKAARTAKPTTKPFTGKRYNFVALGDSLTAWPSGYPWPNRLDASDVRLTLVNNAGIPGNVTAQMLARLNRDVFDYHPDVVFVMGGTNDIAQGYSTAQTISNLRSIIIACQKRKIRVFLLTIPPDGYTGMAGKINALNTAIIHLANAYKVVYVDVHAALVGSDGTYKAGYGLPDLVHLTNLGSQVLANTVYYRVRRVGY